MVSIDNVAKNDLKKLKKYGFNEEKPKSDREQARYSGATTLILYKTGKLLIQGSADNILETKIIAEFLGIGQRPKFSGIAVGSDESLKGDTFGGIVVCGFKADDTIREELKQIGVKDSKSLLKPEIVELAKELIEKFPNNYHVENIFPKEYNKLNIKMNVTGIMDLLHKKCYNKLSRSAIHIVDKYPGCGVGNIIEEKAESKYYEVAAASIIARYFALRQIMELEMKSGFFIPLGSSRVESGLLELRKKSLNKIDYVKVKFKNVVSFFE